MMNFRLAATLGVCGAISVLVGSACTAASSRTIAPNGASGAAPERVLQLGDQSRGDSVVWLSLDSVVPSPRCSSDAKATVSWAVAHWRSAAGPDQAIDVTYTGRSAIAFGPHAPAEFITADTVLRFPATGPGTRTDESSGAIQEKQSYRIDRGGVARLARASTVRVRLTGDHGHCEFRFTRSAKVRLAYFSKHALGW
jgi:hypothetical protein